MVGDDQSIDLIWLALDEGVVKVALFDIGDNNAPGPDGFSSLE